MIDLTHPDIRASLKVRLLRLRHNYAQLLNTAVTCQYAHVLEQANLLAGRLSGASGAASGAAVAHAIQRTLIDPWEMRDTAFWATPLGQAIAWWDGASYESPVTGPIDRRLLVQATGITRQGAHKAIRKMERDADGNPTAFAVASYLQRKYPHQIEEKIRNA